MPIISACVFAKRDYLQYNIDYHPLSIREMNVNVSQIAQVGFADSETG